MRKSSVALLTVAIMVVGLLLAAVLVPGLGPRAFGPVIDAFGGVTCDDQKCPPDAPWVRPVEAAVTSQFRSADRPDHHGVDMAAARGTVVVAASAGVVVNAECQARLHGETYGCDRDGSWEVSGCGWFVKILHAHRTATLYCHLAEEPEVSVGDTVTTGQVIGVVGSTGNSSEPHLHFETQMGGAVSPPRSATAVDPFEFMAEREAPLTSPA